MTKIQFPQVTVTVDWLKRHLKDPDLVILDASLEKPISSGGQSPTRKQIPGTRRFDLDREFSDLSSTLPHTLPSAADFERQARKLGINNDNKIVVYDCNGVYSSPRARLMFRAMGHDRVAVLDGGLPEWIESNGVVEDTDGSAEAPEGSFNASFQPDVFCDISAVDEAVRTRVGTIVDARSSARFRGIEPEPRLGLRSGHIPYAVNIPFSDVLKGTKLKTREELRRIFARVDTSSGNFIFSCGSGVTACIVALAAEIAGYSHFRVYDGSWAEWGAEDSGRLISRQRKT